MAERCVFGDVAVSCMDLQKAKIVVLPVPYDGTSTWVKGADKGPQAILKASENLEFYDIRTDSQVFDRGIFTAPLLKGFSTPQQMVDAVRTTVAGHLENGKFLVLLGGEHSISIGSVQAHGQAFKDLSILQLDAHADLRDSYEGSAFNHACTMARVREICPIVQVGIRSMDVCEKTNMDRSRVFFAEDICNGGDRRWIDDALELLTDRVYVTIDLDVFDPAIMPATGTPEPGGLGWYDVLAVLKALCRKKQLVGFDVTELCPRPALWACDFTAAKLVYQLLSCRFEDKR